ncbi:MAG: hypothetical protein WCS88_04445 [Patescibacteria group bacterium]|jgi:hypothetical protein
MPPLCQDEPPVNNREKKDLNLEKQNNEIISLSVAVWLRELKILL